MNDRDHLESENALKSELSHKHKHKEIWRFYLMMLLATVIIFMATYWPTLVNIVSIWWKSRTFNHGFVILPISLYLIWEKKECLLQQIPQPSRLAWIALFGFVIIWIVADLADVQLIQQFAVVVMLPILVYVILGRDVVKLILFPLGFLLFAIPFGEFMVPVLQDITAIFTVEALKLTGIPVYLEERYISIPSGNFKVAEACSGVRYLIASIALGTLYAYITYYSLWRRSIFILLSVVVPIAANSVRAYGIVMLAHLSDYEFATGFDHLIYGWLFFGVVMILLFWAGSFFKDQPPENSANISPTENTEKIVVDKREIRTVVLITTIVLISGPLSAQWLNTPIGGAEIIELPQSDGVWSGPIESQRPWNARFEGASSELNGEYLNGQDRIQLYIAYYALQKQGSEIVNSENAFYDETKWRRTSTIALDYQSKEGERFKPGVVQLNFEHRDKIIWHWYEINGTSTNDPLVAKSAQIKAKLLRQNQASAAVIVVSDLTDNKENTQNLIRSFVDQMLPAIKRTIYDK